MSAKRVITFERVKGHSNVVGNDRADTLANLGRQNNLGTHSRRWAAPKQGALTVANAETCRKCKTIFKSARKCAVREMHCTVTPAEVPTDHPSRLCGQPFPDRVTRNAHVLVVLTLTSNVNIAHMNRRQSNNVFVMMGDVHISSSNLKETTLPGNALDVIGNCPIPAKRLKSFRMPLKPTCKPVSWQRPRPS